MTTDLDTEIMARTQADVGAALGRIGADLETRGLSDDQKAQATLALASMLISMAMGAAELALGKAGASRWLASVAADKAVQSRPETLN